MDLIKLKTSSCSTNNFGIDSPISSNLYGITIYSLNRVRTPINSSLTGQLINLLGDGDAGMSTSEQSEFSNKSLRKK